MVKARSASGQQFDGERHESIDQQVGAARECVAFAEKDLDRAVTAGELADDRVLVAAGRISSSSPWNSRNGRGPPRRPAHTPPTGSTGCTPRRLAEHGIATIVVDYRQPSRLESCVLDSIAAIRPRRPARRVRGWLRSVTRSVERLAVNVGSVLPQAVAGVCTLSTQSAGCERAAGLAPRPFLLFHGELDEILPAATSAVVRQLAGGHGTVEILLGEGHALAGCTDLLVDRLMTFAIELLPAG